MKYIKTFIALVFFAAAAPASPGSSSFDFLDVPASASLALGTIRTGPQAALANPALAGLENTALEFSYARWMGNLSLASAGFGQRLSGRFSLAAYMALMNLSEELKAYDGEGIPTGEANYGNYRYASALSFRASNVLSLGLGLTAAGEDLDGDAQSAILPSAGFELRGRFGIFRRAAVLFADVSGEPDTRFSAWHRMPLSKIDYSGEEFAPLSVSEAAVTEHIGNFSLTLGLRSADGSGFRAAVKYRFEDIVMEFGILSESESDLMVGAGISFEFRPVTVDLSYLTRADAGSSIFSTLKYEFDMPGFIGGVAERSAERRAEARRYVRVGNVSDMASTVSQRGDKEIWLNFSSDIAFSGAFVITKDNIIIARGRVINRQEEDPYLYEGLVLGHELIRDFNVGDIVAVQQAQVQRYQADRQKRLDALSSALDRRIREQEELLKTADLMRWNSSSQKEIASRVYELRKEGNLEECGDKLGVLEKSTTKLFEDNIKAMIAESGELAADARMVGVNVSYPESLALKSEGALKSKKYKEALSDISASLQWLHKSLDEIENQ